MDPSSTPLSKGVRTRERLFEAAVTRFSRDGYGGASLRSIAKDAGVSPGLLYRYFPSKEALVAELYARCLGPWAERAAALEPGTWAQRTLALTRLAFEVLGEHRRLLRVLVPSMLDGDPVVSPLRNERARELARPSLREAVATSRDAPSPRRLDEVAELAYLLHLALILFWVNDDSAELQATEELMQRCERLAPWLVAGLRAPVVGRQLLELSQLVARSLAKEA